MPRVDHVVERNILLFYNRIFRVDSPLQRLQVNMLSHYITTGVLIKNSLLHNIVTRGYSPIAIGFNDIRIKLDYGPNNGIIDSLKYILCKEDFDSSDHLLVRLLTNVF